MSRRLPNLDRLSILTATILLAYASARFIDLPSRELAVQLPGIFLSILIDTNTVTAILVAGLTASGTHWLIRDHSSLQDKSILEHIILPGLTALVIGLPLNNLPQGPTWWWIFFAGGLALLLVFAAEYIAVDIEDSRYPLAAAVLIASSFGLYLVLAINLRAADTRLFLLLPALALPAGLVSLRTLHLRLRGPWQIPQALTVTIVLGQFIAALHYLPTTPTTFGLLVVGGAYSLTTLIANFSQGKDFSQSITEPAIIFLVLFGLALWIR
jgi:hypothetical protein